MRRLNHALFCVIDAVQARYHAMMAEQIIREQTHQQRLNPVGETRRFYHAIPADFLAKAGLMTTEEDFQAVMAFKITEEMRRCPVEQLERFAWHG